MKNRLHVQTAWVIHSVCSFVFDLQKLVRFELPVFCLCDRMMQMAQVRRGIEWSSRIFLVGAVHPHAQYSLCHRNHLFDNIVRCLYDDSNLNVPKQPQNMHHKIPTEAL